MVNHHPRVAPETVKAVRRAMEQLNYTPSARRPGPKPARRQEGAVHLALLVFGETSQQTSADFGELMRGVSQAAQQHGVTLAYHQIAAADPLPGSFLDQRLDGLLLHGVRPSDPVRERLQRVPAVWLMGNCHRPSWGDRVMPDYLELGERAAGHLVARRHTELAIFNLDPEHWALHWCAASFAAAARNAGARVEMLEHPRGEPAERQAFNHRAVEQLTRRFLQLKPRPTGVCVVDAAQAALIQPALQEAGVALGPGECEVVCCNNHEAYLVGLNPRPAAFDTRAVAVGRRGVEMMLWRLEHRHETERMTCVVEPTGDGAAAGP